MNTLLQLAALFIAVPEIEGRKKLQKTVHILQDFGVDFGVKYGYHHYGPFSEQLQEWLQTAQYDKLIEETRVTGQATTYSFKAHERLKELWSKLGNQGPPPWARLAAELNQKTARELEALSTLIYLEKLRGEQVGQEAIDQEFKSLKPHLWSLISESRSYLLRLRKNFVPGTMGQVTIS